MTTAVTKPLTALHKYQTVHGYIDDIGHAHIHTHKTFYHMICKNVCV